MSRNKYYEQIQDEGLSPDDPNDPLVVQRGIMEHSQIILDQLLFGQSPVYAESVAKVKAQFSDRQDQMVVLLATFVAKDYMQAVELRELKAKYLDSLLTPQDGEVVH